MESPEFQGFDNPIIEPPEVREPRERFRIIEFYVELGLPRPELTMLANIRSWLATRGPVPVMGIAFSYHSETEAEPPMLQGLLLIGEPIDLG